MSSGLTDMLREEPPRINDPSELKGAVSYVIGNLVYLHETEWLEDGTIVALIAVVMLGSALTMLLCRPWRASKTGLEEV